jgi:hypothetical protein
MSERRRITRDDLERQIRSLEGDVVDRVESQKMKIIAVAGGTLVVLLVLAYVLGRRKGKQKTTLVEIRRV